jgi:acyl carrier protein
MTQEEIADAILDAVRALNLSRMPEHQVDVKPDARLFGPGSPLDSLGLVSLLIDIEDALRDRGLDISLSDEHAMSQSRSPFRSVQALAAYIDQRQSAGA